MSGLVDDPIIKELLGLNREINNLTFEIERKINAKGKLTSQEKDRYRQLILPLLEGLRFAQKRVDGVALPSSLTM